MVVCYGLWYLSDGDREEMEDFLNKLNEIYIVSLLFCYKNLILLWNKLCEWNDVELSELLFVGENE